MKRLLVVLLVAVCMLVVAAPASASLLRGSFTSGTAYPQALPDAPDVTALVPTGVMFINTRAGANAVTGTILITCDAPDLMPFPLKFNMSWVKWGRASWPDISGAYTMRGTLSKPGLPPFALTVVANPGSEPTVLTMHIDTIGSDWGWDHWDFTGGLL